MDRAHFLCVLFRGRSLVLLTLALTGVLTIAQNAHAVALATQAEVAAIQPCPSFCGGPGGTVIGTVDGPNLFSSSAELNDALYGSGRAFAEFPTGLKAEAYAAADASVIAEAFGQSLYKYTGPNKIEDYTIALDGLLTGEASVEATLAVIKRENNYDLDLWGSPGTLLFEVVPGTPDLTLIDSVTLTLDVGVGQHTKIDNILAQLNTNDEFYVWIYIKAIATRGGVADAYDSFTFAFETPEYYIQIPEPTSAVLLLSGLVLLSVRHKH